jgi:hypothetical protein
LELPPCLFQHGSLHLAGIGDEQNPIDHGRHGGDIGRDHQWGSIDQDEVGDASQLGYQIDHRFRAEQLEWAWRVDLGPRLEKPQVLYAGIRQGLLQGVALARQDLSEPHEAVLGWEVGLEPRPTKIR